MKTLTIRNTEIGRYLVKIYTLNFNFKRCIGRVQNNLISLIIPINLQY